MLVFARAPIAGEAKTRLIRALGPEAAAQLQARMTLRALETACAADVGAVTLWCAPDTAHPFFAACQARFGVTLAVQRGPTLGERLLAAHTAAFDAHARMLAIGTDCPILTSADLRAAAAALDQDDAAMIPAEDGGYVLLGLARRCPEAFRCIDWGSARVLAQTRERLAGSGFSCRVLAPLWDVDRPDDLARLALRMPQMVADLELQDPACRGARAGQRPLRHE